MRTLGRWLVRLLAVLLFGLAVLALALKLRYGGGATDFPDRTGEPQLPESAIEVVAELPTPPGNIAVAADGRVFVTLHPEARPQWNVVELVRTSSGSDMQPWPDAAWQDRKQEPRAFQSVLSIRIDRQNRLWALDAGHHGLSRGRLLAFDVASGELVHEFEFPRDLAGRGSHLNDFQVSRDGRHLFIADASFFAKTPALLVYDVERRSARRLLENHASVRPEFYTPVVQGREMEALGLVSIRPGVDSIALTRDGKWLAFAAVTSRKLYGAPVAALLNESLAAHELAKRIYSFADKTMSDGLSTDEQGNFYLTDPEHSAIVQLRPDRRLITLVKSEKLLRWPDGLSFGPDGWLYVTCSSLHDILGRPPWAVARHAPYRVVRFKPGPSAPAGH